MSDVATEARIAELEGLVRRFIDMASAWQPMLDERSEVAIYLRDARQAIDGSTATCGYVDANGGPCISPKGHPEGQHADEDFGQLQELSRLRSFAEKVAVSMNDTMGTRGAARYALTGSLEGMMDEMRREG